MDSTKNELFLGRMTALNRCFVRFVLKNLEDFPGADLTPTLNSYFKHVAELDKKFTTTEEAKPTQAETPSLASKNIRKRTLPPSFEVRSFASKRSKDESKPEQNENGKISAPSTNLGFPSFSTISAKESVSPVKLSLTPTTLKFPVFGNKESTSVDASTSKQFENGKIATTPSEITFSDLVPKNVENHVNTAEHDENEEPPKVEIVEQKEDGALFFMKTAIFTYKEKKWEKLGVAYVNVMPGDEKGNRLLVRAANTLGNIWINTYIAEHFKAFLKDEKAMTVRFPDVDKDKKTTIVQYLMKGGNSEDFKKLADLLKANILIS